MVDVGNKTLLLVEDEAVIALSESMMLKRNGYRVHLANSGNQAIETARTIVPIDLVLMDIDLGAGMDGSQAAERIIADAKLPVLFLSSHTEPEVVAKTEGISSLGYVLKNSGETVLLASIRMALRLHEARVMLQRKAEDLAAANLALGKSEAEFRGLFETGPVAVGMLVNRAFAKVNRKMRDTFGYSEAEMLGRTTRILYESDAEYERVGRELYAELGRSGISTIETRLRTKDGTVLDILVYARPLEGVKGSSAGVVVTALLDVTERHRLEAELRAFREGRPSA
jgi:PAS domain S-box-containing protein